MGKFCVKAAIVSSLAIAEEDYDTTIGAPIELKRNLIARGTARPLKKGQTPQIISGGGPLRALNEEGGWVASILDWITCSTCKQKDNSNQQELENKIVNMEEEMDNMKEEMENTMGTMFSGLKEKITTNANKILNTGGIIGKAETLLNIADQSMAEMKEKFVKKEQELESGMVDLRNSITNLSNDPKQLGVLKIKIDGILTITEAIGELILPEDMRGSAAKMTDSLRKVQKELENKKEEAQKSFKGTIEKQFELADKELENLSGIAKKWIKEVEKKIEESSKVTDALKSLSSLVGFE